MGRQLSHVLTAVQIHDGLQVVTPATLWAQLAEELTVDELIAVGDALVREPRRSDGSRGPAGSGRTTLEAARGRSERRTSTRRSKAARSAPADSRRRGIPTRDRPAARSGPRGSARTDTRLRRDRAGGRTDRLHRDRVSDVSGARGVRGRSSPDRPRTMEPRHREARPSRCSRVERCSVLTSRHLYPGSGAAVSQVREALIRAGWRP